MRRILKPIVIGVSLVLVVALVGATALSLYIGRRPLPTTQGERTVDGITGEITIIRNEQGVPFIFADTDHDLFFGQGYAQAQDRFFEMDYRRHVTAGRVAELVGNVQTAIEADTVIRTLGWRHVAEQEWELLSPETQELMQSFADGVNAYIGPREGSQLGLEYTVLGVSVSVPEIEPWDPIDSLTWMKAMAWDLKGNYYSEIERTQVMRTTSELSRVHELFPEYPFYVNAPILGVPVVEPAGGVEPDGDETDGGESGDAAEPIEADSALYLDGLDGASAALASAYAALDAIPSLYGEGEGIGSNSFVIGGEHTETGAPILANDPHLNSSAPGIWYQSGLHCRELTDGCTFDVSGFTFAGLPGVVIGQNTELAWGLTNMGADVTDFFFERVRPDGTYLYDERDEPLETRTETIRVADSEPIEITVRSTVHGPIVSDVLSSLAFLSPGRPKPANGPAAGVDGFEVSLGWTALTPGRSMEAIFAINRAATADDVADAAALFEVPAQNIVFATASGDIGYQAPGRIPIRTEIIAGEVEGIDTSWPRLGWDPQYDWQGFVPAENLPRALNPEEGFFVAANQPITMPGYSVYLTEDWDYGFRAQRLRDLIEEKIEVGEKITVEDANAFMVDNYSPLAETLVSAIDALNVQDRYLRTAIDQLHEWRDEGYQNDVDSAGAAYFNAIWAHLLNLTFADELRQNAWPSGGSRSVQVMINLLKDPENDWWDYRPTVNVTETRNEILLQALTHARNELTNRLGSDASRWRWGDLHEARLQHPILSEDVAPWPLSLLTNPRPFEVSGSATSPNATSWDAAVRHESGRMDFSMTSSPSMRMVVDIDDRDSSTWVASTGVSGHPTSSHYADQINAWAAGEYFTWSVTPNAIEAAGSNTLTLQPGS